MKAIFSGYYGMENSGDDAFVEVAAWGSQKFWKSDEQLFFSEKLPIVRSKTSNYMPNKSHLSFAKAIFDVFSSEIFVSAGGSTFHSALKKTDIRTYAKLKKRTFFSGQTGAIGISLGPYKNSVAEKSTVNYLKSLDFLALRDTRSYLEALNYDLPYKPVEAFDLAALLPEVYNMSVIKEFSNKTPVVGISVCNYESYINGDLQNEKRRNQFIIDLINQLKDNIEIKFRFFIFNGHPHIGDEKLTYEILDKVNWDGKLNFEIIPYNPNVEFIYGKIAECDSVVSTRLHASIFACYSNTPFFLLEYHQKCTDFLLDVGQLDKCRLYDGQREVKNVCDTILRILFENEVVSPINIESTISRAKLNFTATFNKTS